MTVGFACIIFAILLIAVLLLRIKIDVVYESEEFTAEASVLFLRFRIYPRRKDVRRRERMERRQKKHGIKKRVSKKSAEKKDFREIASVIIRVLRKLRRRILIEKLIIAYIAGGRDDPASAAVGYGIISAVFGVSRDVLETAFRVKDYELYTNVNFIARESSVYVNAKASLSVWELIYIAFGEISVLKDKKVNDERGNSGSHNRKSNAKIKE